MALDGAFLRHLKKEIETAAIGAKVDKVYQPNREEMVLLLRSREGAFKLLLSTRANSARLHFTRFVPENPAQPPMLCMLLRKRLGGARLVGVRQPELERVLLLDFDAANDLGDRVRLTLAMEIMGRYSNVIFVDEDGKVIDALKRVDADMSSERLVLPGLKYELPPPQNKLCALTATAAQAEAELNSRGDGVALDKALLAALQGVSPIVAREAAHFAGRGAELRVGALTVEQQDRLQFFLTRLFLSIQNIDGTPYMVSNPDGKPVDFSYCNIEQYGRAGVLSRHDSFSELLDAFYDGRDRLDRMRVRSQDLLRVLSNAADRLTNKINKQRTELQHCAERDGLRLCGELVSANLYRLERGQAYAELENFYEEGQPLLRVKLDPMRTPSQNAQKYFKDYRKARTAEEKLTEQIEQAGQELAYIDTVFEELSRAETERDLSEIRQELTEQGYVRASRSKQKPPAGAAPLAFTTSDGFLVLVGRNNRQNDRLTLKQAGNNDYWFHTKNIPGSHTILFTEGREPTETALREAAALAAFHSRGKGGSQVPVDYTQVRHVSKPSGAKPGMVIYVNNSTLYVTPSQAMADQLAAK